MLSNRHNYQFLISLDADDVTMNTVEMKQYLDDQAGLVYYYGDNKSKVQAINADINKVSEFDILVLMSDDMVPVVEGYDDIIAEHMTRYFNDLSGVLHYDDGRTGKELNTLSIMGYNLYKKWGYIYHPDYTSLWCDNEFQEASEKVGKAIYINQVVIRHVWEKYLHDPLHHRNDKFYDVDHAVFLARKAQGFPSGTVLPLPNPVAPPVSPRPQVLQRPSPSFQPRARTVIKMPTPIKVIRRPSR